MRLFLACFLIACGNNPVDDIVPIDVDATIDHRNADVFFPPSPDAGPDGPVFVGGPLKCGACTCDGTLYACLVGSCETQPPSDAGADGDASETDASDASCGKNVSCWQIPIECLPKPTCECITNATGLSCVIVTGGNGFALGCP